jgi:integrase
MQYSFERGFCDHNPARGLRRFKETPSSRKLNESQLKVFAEALESSWCHDDIKLWVRVALATGCRGKEVSGMDWSEIDGSTWTLPGSRTKSGREHLVFVPESLMTAIGSSRSHRTGKVLNATSEGARQALKRIAVEANLPHFSNHDLRRTASTLLAIEGVSGETRSRILNHTIGGITERNYTCYDFREEKLEAYQKLWKVLRRVGILV